MNLRLLPHAGIKSPGPTIALNEAGEIHETVDRVLWSDAMTADHVHSHAMKMRRVTRPSSGPQAEA